MFSETSQSNGRVIIPLLQAKVVRSHSLSTMNDEPDVYEPEFLLESERVIVLKVYNKAVRTHTDHLWIKVEPDSVVNWPIYVSTLTPNEYKYNKQCEYGRPLLNDRFHSFLAQLDNTIPVVSAN